MSSPFRSLGLALTLCCASLATSSLAYADQVRVFAAASLSDALDAAVERYQQQHPDVEVQTVYASSSTAARQIVGGAAADLFISADQQWMDWLGEQGEALGERGDLLANRLALIAPGSSTLEDFTPDAEHRLLPLLGDDERLAVGDPDHVPAGIYARQAFEHLGEWQELEPRLARADNVRGALALVEQGEVPLGVVYATDAKASEGVRLIGLFPTDSHPPITYPIALVGDSPSAAAQALRAWLASADGLAVFEQYGFSAAVAE